MRQLLWISRVLWLLLAVSVAATSFTGCSGGGAGGGDSGDKKRIIILTNGNSPFWDACRAGVQDANKDLKLEDDGLVATLEVNNGTIAGQLEKLRQYATQDDIAGIGVSAIVANNQSLAEELRALQKKGIKVVTIDSDVDRKSMRDARFAFIGTDNLKGGKELGICARGIHHGQGNYVTFVGFTDAQNARERIQGFADGAGPDFKSLDSMPDKIDKTKARENVRKAIENNPDLNVLVGIWSYNAPAIVDVVSKETINGKSRRDFTIVTFDAEPLAVDQMADHQIDAMVVQNPYKMGYDGVRLLKALTKDDKATIKEMLPHHGEADGDIYDTGLKVVVPDEGSPLKADLFDKNTQFLKLSEFRAWLKKYNLTGS